MSTRTQVPAQLRTALTIIFRRHQLHVQAHSRTLCVCVHTQVLAQLRTALAISPLDCGRITLTSTLTHMCVCVSTRRCWHSCAPHSPSALWTVAVLLLVVLGLLQAQVGVVQVIMCCISFNIIKQKALHVQGLLHAQVGLVQIITCCILFNIIIQKALHVQGLLQAQVGVVQVIMCCI
jgi:hypothetical protein